MPGIMSEGSGRASGTGLPRGDAECVSADSTGPRRVPTPKHRLQCPRSRLPWLRAITSSPRLGAAWTPALAGPNTIFSTGETAAFDACCKREALCPECGTARLTIGLVELRLLHPSHQRGDSPGSCSGSPRIGNDSVSQAHHALDNSKDVSPDWIIDIMAPVQTVAGGIVG